jgi:DegT/DnrJ/EryC1/StrS aminotransferase family
LTTEGETAAITWLSDNYGPGDYFLGNRASELLFDLLRSLGRESGGVILPASTCHALAQTVIIAGYIPIFADIEIHDLNISIRSVKSAFQDSVVDIVACIAVHSYGNFCDLEEIAAFCKQEKIILIEDICQLVGSGREGKTGDVILLSFGYSKPIDIGGGGAIILKSAALSDKMKQMRSKASDIPSNSPGAQQFLDDYYLIRDRERKGEIAPGSIKNLTYLYSNYIIHGETRPDWDRFGSESLTLNERNKNRLSKAVFLHQELSNCDEISVFNLSRFSVPWRFSFLILNSIHQYKLTELLRSNVRNASNWYPNLALDFASPNAFETSNATLVGASIVNLWVDEDSSESYLFKAVETIYGFFHEMQKK